MTEHATEHDAGHGRKYTGDVNVGLLVTLFLTGGLFLVAFLFFMVGFFDYMAYQGRIEKVINQPYQPLISELQPQIASLHQGAKVPIDQAMRQTVQHYQQQAPASH